MKTFKRNAVIITVLLFVCVAAYLNWSYNKNSEVGTADEVSSQETADPAAPQDDTSAVSPEGSLYYEADKTTVNKEYFSSARLNRQQARDAAASTLTSVTESDGASQDVIDAALQEISEIAALTLKEAQLEDLIKAKGFDDCVVYISDEDVTVSVPAPQEGLAASSVARIVDIVTSQTDYKATDLKINEVK